MVARHANARSRPYGKTPPLAWGQRKAPPWWRQNITSEARLAAGGGHKIHLTVDLDEGGRPCAIAVSVHKEGAVFRGMLDGFADQASIALEYGAPIQEVAMRMRYVRFEPDGEVEGHPTIRRCTSLVDLLGQMLLAEFPTPEMLANQPAEEVRFVAALLGGGEMAAPAGASRAA